MEGKSMKILTQSRQSIFDFTGDVWVTEAPDGGLVVAEKASGSPYIGTYKDLDRAAEVLNEIFQYYRNGKKSYIMPLE